jgi:hypothetical protein
VETIRFTAASERPLDPAHDPSDRSILIGIVCTLLFHVLLVVLAPRFDFAEFSGIHTGIHVTSVNKGKTFDFELTDALRPPEKQRNPFQFVETNPDAPANEPDKTDNFSNRNQQSAQQEKPKEIDPLHRPSITNAQDAIKNDTAIVSGDMSRPQEGAAPQLDTATAQQEQAEQKQQKEQVPLSGFDKTEGKSEDGIATNVADSKKPSTGADRAVDGARDAQEVVGGLTAVTAAHHAQPKARPRLTAPRTTILSNRAPGVANIGILGIDARWSEYGEYLQELIEIVQAQWWRINDESRVSPPRGSHVAITFKLNSRGEADIVKVEDSDAGKQGVFSCQSAILARQPYRKWTEQMIAVLGEEQQMTFVFYYY